MFWVDFCYNDTIITVISDESVYDSLIIMYLKDFDLWNGGKKDIHYKGENKFYHEREIWWCSLGINIGSEQDGTSVTYERPILILKGFSRNICLIAPLTTSMKQHSMRIPVCLIHGKQASVILSQIRVIDTKRLVNRISFINQTVFENIRKTVKELL